MNQPAGHAAAPTAGDLIALTVALGWEGWWVTGLGLWHGVWTECLVGLLITILTWRHIGMAWHARRRAANAPPVGH